MMPSIQGEIVAGELHRRRKGQDERARVFAKPRIRTHDLDGPSFKKSRGLATYKVASGHLDIKCARAHALARARAFFS